jgi:hypothetical protein
VAAAGELDRDVRHVLADAGGVGEKDLADDQHRAAAGVVRAAGLRRHGWAGVGSGGGHSHRPFAV